MSGTFPVVAGESRVIDVGVTNLGTETWAWGWHGRPEIRLSYLGPRPRRADAAASRPRPGERRPCRSPCARPTAGPRRDHGRPRARAAPLVRLRRRDRARRAASPARGRARRPAARRRRLRRRVDEVLLGLDAGSSRCSSGRSPTGCATVSACRPRARCRPGGPTRPRRPRRIAAKPAPHSRSRRCASAAAETPARASGGHAYRLSRSVLMRLLRIPKAHLMPSCEESP